MEHAAIAEFYFYNDSLARIFVDMGPSRRTGETFNSLYATFLEALKEKYGDAVVEGGKAAWMDSAGVILVLLQNPETTDRESYNALRLMLTSHENTQEFERRKQQVTRKNAKQL